MRGIDLCRGYFDDLIKPLLRQYCPEIERFAAGLLGWGSDVLGHDDAWSRDHEWGPRCQLFLREEDAGACQRVYALLNQHAPSHFEGYATRFKPHPHDPSVRVPTFDPEGRVHVQVTTCAQYWRQNLGMVEPSGDLDWLGFSEQRLLELTRGEVFHDSLGTLTRLRALYAYYPIDVWKHRLAYAWQALGWDIDLIGLTAARDDPLSARHCVGVSVHRIMRLLFLLNRTYGPLYAKWLQRELQRLPGLLPDLIPRLEVICTSQAFAEVTRDLEALCEELLAAQDRLGLLPAMLRREPPFGRGFFRLDLQFVADQIRETLSDEWRQLPLIGAADQWVIQYDILLDAHRLRAVELSALTEPHGQPVAARQPHLIHNSVDKAVDNLLDNYVDIPSGREIVILFDADKSDLAHGLHDGISRRGAIPLLLALPDCLDTLPQHVVGLLPNDQIGLLVLASHRMWRAGLGEYLELGKERPTLRSRCHPLFFDAVIPRNSFLRLYGSSVAHDRAYLSALAGRLPSHARVHITAPGGTDLCLRTRGWQIHDWEVLTSPDEASIEGCIVADASVFLGKVCSPITVTLQAGRIASITCEDPHDPVFEQYARSMEDALAGSWANGQLAELGLGGNAGATVSGIIMEDEAVRETCHFCFGDNARYGGRNHSRWHGGTCVVRLPHLELAEQAPSAR
jgi:hypothetical protein